jgi:probable phosphoglycerate mutase
MADHILLARHGQTEWNVQGRRQGHLDSPLTDLGQAQGRRNAAALHGHQIDAVFTSPLGRARSTAEIFASALGVTVHVLDELAEVHHGRFAGLTNAQIEAAFPGELARRRLAKYEWRFPGGESYADADRRAAAALAAIRTHPVSRPLVVSHEMIGRMLLRNLLGLTPPESFARDQPNDVVYQVDCAARTVAEIGRYSGSL